MASAGVYVRLHFNCTCYSDDDDDASVYMFQREWVERMRT